MGSVARFAAVVMGLAMPLFACAGDGQNTGTVTLTLHSEQRVLLDTDEAKVVSHDPPRLHQYDLRADGVDLESFFEHARGHGLDWSFFGSGEDEIMLTAQAERIDQWDLLFALARAMDVEVYSMGRLSRSRDAIDPDEDRYQIKEPYVIRLVRPGEDAFRELVNPRTKEPVQQYAQIHLLYNQKDVSDFDRPELTMIGVRKDGTTEVVKGSPFGHSGGRGWYIKSPLDGFDQLKITVRAYLYRELLSVRTKVGADFQVAGRRFHVSSREELLKSKPVEEDADIKLDDVLFNMVALAFHSSGDPAFAEEGDVADFPPDVFVRNAALMTICRTEPKQRTPDVDVILIDHELVGMTGRPLNEWRFWWGYDGRCGQLRVIGMDLRRWDTSKITALFGIVAEEPEETAFVIRLDDASNPER